MEREVQKQNKTKQKLPAFVWVLVTLFIGAILINIGMVATAVKNNSQLVRPNYYEHAMKQDSLHADSKRVDSLGIEIELKKSGNHWLIILDVSDTPALRQQSTRGRIHFYRPSDSQKDRHLPLTQHPGTATLTTPEVYLEKGPWKANVSLMLGPHKLRKSFNIFE